MATERVNGIPYNVERLSDEEVFGVLDNAVERMYRSEEDVRRVLGWAAARGLVSVETTSDHYVEVLDA